MVQFHPNTFWATNDLVLLLLDKGAVLEAAIHSRNAVRIAGRKMRAVNGRAAQPAGRSFSMAGTRLPQR